MFRIYSNNFDGAQILFQRSGSIIRFSEIQINNINDDYYHHLYGCFDFIEFMKKGVK